MFKFFKRFHEPEPEKIGLDKIESWFDNKTAAYNVAAEESVKSLQLDLNELLEKMKEDTEKLENAVLQNPNIPVRELQFMKGNRAFYVNRVQIFVKGLRFPKSVREIDEAYKEFYFQLESFGKSTAKPYQILQHFFEHETHAIAESIRKIDGVFGKLKIVKNDSRIDASADVNSLIQELKHKIGHKSRLEKEIRGLESKITDIDSAIRAQQSELLRIEKSKDQQKLSFWMHEKQRLEKESGEIETLVTHLFSNIEMALKKHEHSAFEHKKLIEQYLSNPMKALIDDNELHFADVVDKLKALIEQNKIELKDKKREKTLETLYILTKVFLHNLANRFRNAQSSIASIEGQVIASKILENKYNLQNEIKNSTLKLEQTRMELQKVQKDFQDISIETLKKELAARIREAVKTGVVIV
jgi:hypothetical protein